MSVLATNIGFSTAIFNPFTIGIAHKLSGLPLYSGALPRLALFIVVFPILAAFLVLYARKIDRKPENSSVYQEDQVEKVKYGDFQGRRFIGYQSAHASGSHFSGTFFALILVVLVALPVIPLLRDIRPAANRFTVRDRWYRRRIDLGRR